MTREDCLLLGTIRKTHGIRGELVLRVKNPAFEPDENWESLFLQIDGILVPFFISVLHPINPDEWIVSFDDYESKEKAIHFAGCAVWILRDLFMSENETFLPDELEGYSLTNVRTGRVGQITGFIDIPDNPLFEVSMEGEKLMVPAQDEWVEELDREHRRLLMNLPDGMM